MTDVVNHPPHYTGHPSGIECIEITRRMSFCLGNAFKYVWRAGMKVNAIQDLKKALWYVREGARGPRMPHDSDASQALTLAVHHDPVPDRGHALAMLWFADTFPFDTRAEMRDYAERSIRNLISIVENGGTL